MREEDEDKMMVSIISMLRRKGVGIQTLEKMWEEVGFYIILDERRKR